jgi:hypothetical protein
MTVLTREPMTTPHGLPVVRPAYDVELSAPGSLRAAMQAADAALEVAEQLGLPEPLPPVAVSGGRIEARLLWPDLFRWMEMLRGLKIIGWQRGDYSVAGWTETDHKGDDGEVQTRRQYWLLRPVAEYDCRRCIDLPEPARPPLSPEAWAADAWWRLVGKRWEEETGPRAHLVPRVSRVGDEVGRHRPSPQRRAAGVS